MESILMRILLKFHSFLFVVTVQSYSVWWYLK